MFSTRSLLDTAMSLPVAVRVLREGARATQPHAMLLSSRCASQNALGPVPEVDVMAKRPQGLLDVGDSFRADGGAAFLRS
jgi:hypothetical protein